MIFICLMSFDFDLSVQIHAGQQLGEAAESSFTKRAAPLVRRRCAAAAASRRLGQMEVGNEHERRRRRPRTSIAT